MKTIKNLLKRLIIVVCIAYSISTVLIVIFSMISTSFLPMRLINGMGFRMASDDIARMASMPLAFLLPALILIVLLPNLSFQPKIFVWAYALLSLAGICLLAIIIYPWVKPDPYDPEHLITMKLYFTYMLMCAVAVVFVESFLIKKWKMP